MIPSSSTSSTQVTFRTTVSENIEDAVSGELMTRAVTLFPCGHTFNEDTVIQCLARNKLCPLDRRFIERHAPNYTVRHLAETAESHPLEELKHEPSEEAVGHFLRGKELAEKGEHATAIEALLQALQLTPTYEKAQAYLEFCLKRSSEASLSFQQVPPLSIGSRDKGKEKSLSSTDSPKERYTELLFNLLEEPSIQENSILKKILKNQVEGLMSEEREELTEKEKVSYKWTEKLLGENKKVRQFVVEKLRQIHQQSSCLASVPPQPSIPSSSTISSKGIQPLSPPSTTPISMASLYNAIMQFHFPERNGDSIAQADILDKIYEIEPTLSIEEKVPYIFQKLFTLAASLSPLEFEGNTKESKAITLSNYSSYLLNINRLLLWQKLPGGTEYLNQVHIKSLPLKKKGELLTQWIEEQGKNIIKLDLDDELDLTILPPEIWQLSQLEWLNLSNNQLTTLPPNIGQLSQLQSLWLHNNQLTAIPAEIGQLTKLEVLNLGHNQLNIIPAEIGQLTKLQGLALGFNQLTIIPAEIGQLSHLRMLHLGDNQLTIIPAEIGQLSQLRSLDLSYNQLTIIPAEIGQLSQLQKLYLSFNQLTIIPAEIGQLSHLHTLRLSNNQLIIIPAEIGQLSQLDNLWLSSNQLTAIPAEIGHLSQLDKLWLNSNQLTAIPAEIGQLSRLQELDLRKNQLMAIPAEIRQLSQLQRLWLSYNQLAAIPAEIGQLSHLQELDLRKNQLNALPVQIGQLSHLQEFWLSDNKLNALPAEIGQLSQLQALDLSNNQLTAIPAEIGQLSQLQRLWLSDNKLTALPAEIGQLSHLRMLHLGDNQLTIIPAEVGQLSQLRSLDLSYNQLTVIPPLPKLRSLKIDGNPLQMVI
ncbi:leucine-rich repeat domain-containing protein [Neochlamydia sp. EPS4]|uniref:leucine-rich repeat domain-containing protein n=1 Tax=Neochlamydia sp. EPS4 TaxID=1478175 RepID=UPI00069337BF|nr:leucine-rich repeat domain-containing protein [Neochlamydia sp. EPS4]